VKKFFLFKRQQAAQLAVSTADLGLTRISQTFFSTKPGNDHLLDKEFVEEEKKLFSENFDSKQK